MIKEIYKINSEETYVDVYLGNLKENTYYNGEEWVEIDFDYVELLPPNAKKVKWENGEWVIVEKHPVEPQEPQPPTDKERLEALEMAVITITLGGI